MNANDRAFSAGHPLWVIENNPDHHWWKQLDFRSGYFLSRLNETATKDRPEELHQIINETQFPVRHHQANKSWLLWGCRNHFACDWVFVIQDKKNFNEKDLLKILVDLNIKDVRFFSPFEPSASLKASLSSYDTVSELNN